MCQLSQKYIEMGLDGVYYAALGGERHYFTDDEFDQFISRAYSNSVVDNQGVTVTKEDRIVTLSTCTGDDSTRFVVMGKLAQIYAAR